MTMHPKPTGLFAIDGDRDGDTYEPQQDRIRLNKQAREVWDLMRDGKWRELWRIADATGCPIQSVSARLRDFRKERFGSHEVDRRRVKGGVFQYRLIVNGESLMAEGSPK